MSKHPIPDWLCSQFSLIEDEVQKLGPCGVFTQMRTVTQTYFEQQPAAPQPPALGGEPEVLTLIEQGMWSCFGYGKDDYRGCTREQIEETREAVRTRIAPLQTEIERLKDNVREVTTYRDNAIKKIERLRNELTGTEKERDLLKARFDELQCDHEWTDDGEFNLHCTKCGKQENHEPYGWVQTRGNAINRFTQEWDVVEEWETQGFGYKAMFDAALSKPAGSEQ